MNGRLHLAFISLMLCCGISVAMAQENTEPNKNPFPLSERKIARLLAKSERTIEKIMIQYPDSNLAAWLIKDREDYLKAKATKVVALLAPDFIENIRLR